jgi:hypothetical protein
MPLPILDGNSGSVTALSLWLSRKLFASTYFDNRQLNAFSED